MKQTFITSAHGITEQQQLLKNLLRRIFQRKTVIGYTEVEVLKDMTQYQQIEFLEDLVKDHSSQSTYREVDDVLLKAIDLFLIEVTTLKESFKTAKDARASQRPKPFWKAEVARKGITFVLADRLQFHGALTIQQIMDNVGVGLTTAKKYAHQLCESGHATLVRKAGYETGTRLERVQIESPTEEHVAPKVTSQKTLMKKAKPAWRSRAARFGFIKILIAKLKDLKEITLRQIIENLGVCLKTAQQYAKRICDSGIARMHKVNNSLTDNRLELVAS
jgi:predicted transcriptional regulator